MLVGVLLASGMGLHLNDGFDSIHFDPCSEHPSNGTADAENDSQACDMSPQAKLVLRVSSRVDASVRLFVVSADEDLAEGLSLRVQQRER